MRRLALIPCLFLIGCDTPRAIIPTGHVVVQGGTAYPVAIAQDARTAGPEAAEIVVRVDGGYVACAPSCGTAILRYTAKPDPDLLIRFAGPYTRQP